MKKMASVFGFALASTLVSALAWAGAKSTALVSINTVTGVATGSIGSARNSADTVQWIGCRMVSGVASCTAVNSAGVAANCSSASSTIVNSVEAIASDSYIEFHWDDSGACTYLKVSTFSDWAPKAP